MRVGFIGLGNMGKPMVQNLLNAGFKLTVFNRSKKNIQEVIARGAKWASCPKEVAERSDILISMLPSGLEVNEIVIGDKGILKGANEGLLYVDMSTIGPRAIKEIGVLAKKYGIRVLDAPVSGGQLGAQNGSLSIMIGGNVVDVECCMPVFKILGDNIVHVGKLGAGQITKLCNQIICDLNILATCEGLSLASSAGLDFEKVYSVLVNGAANSWILEHLGRNIINRNFKANFTIDLQKKDADLSDEITNELKVPLPGTAVVNQLLRIADALGLGGNGPQSIIQVYEHLRMK